MFANQPESGRRREGVNRERMFTSTIWREGDEEALDAGRVGKRTHRWGEVVPKASYCVAQGYLLNYKILGRET